MEKLIGIGLAAIAGGFAYWHFNGDSIEARATNARDVSIVEPLRDAVHDVRQRRYDDVWERDLPRINLQPGSTPHGDRIREAERNRKLNDFYDACKASWNYWTD
jgi:hypothetical protein